MYIILSQLRLLDVSLRVWIPQKPRAAYSGEARGVQGGRSAGVGLELEYHVQMLVPSLSSPPSHFRQMTRFQQRASYTVL